MIETYTARQAREISNTQQKFARLQELQQKQRSFKGTMTYRKTKGIDYLVRWSYHLDKAGNSIRKAKVLGAKSEETDQLLEKFLTARKLLDDQTASLKRDLEDQASINRQIGIGRVPELSARILRKFEQAGIGSSRMRVVGTHALYVYEMLAGVMLDEDVTGTEDIDFLLDAREALHFVVDDELDAARLINLLRSVDRSFERTNRTYRAANRDGFLVDFIKPETRDPWVSQGLETKPDDVQPSPVEGQAWLINAQNVSVTLIDQRGMPLTMSAPDPRAFAIHKLWLSTLPSRDPLKKGRDKLQATLVASMVHHHMADRFPWEAKQLRSLPKQLVDEALETFQYQFAREDEELAKTQSVDIDALIEELDGQ